MSQDYGDNTPPSQQPPNDSTPPLQNPYGSPSTGYGTPPQNPYGAPQNPYGVPQNPYGTPPPGYGVPPPGPGSEPAFSGPAGNQYRLRPLPLNEAIRQLPNQYVRVLTKPSAAVFAEELPKSSWDITLVQILFMIVVAIVIGLIRVAIAAGIANASLASSGFSGNGLGAASSLIYATSFGSVFLSILIIPVSFFIGVGVQFLLAKAFQGEGTFLTQSYTSLLYQVPMYIISALLSLLTVIPVAGSILSILVSLAVFVYSVVLNVFQLMAVHRLSGGKAVWVVLIPYIVVFVLLLLCGLVAGALIVSALKNMQ